MAALICLQVPVAAVTIEQGGNITLPASGNAVTISADYLIKTSPVYNGAEAALTIGGTVQMFSLTTDAQPNFLDLTSNKLILAGPGGSVLNGSLISLAPGILQLNGGSLTINGTSNAFAGTLDLTGSANPTVATFAGSGSFGTATTTVIGGGTLVFAGSNDQAFSGTLGISGTPVTISKLSTGNLDIIQSGSNFANITTGASGIVTLAGGTLNGNVTIVSGAELDLSAADTLISGSLFLSGSGSLGGATLVNKGGSNVINNTLVISGSDPIRVLNASSGTFTINSTIDGASDFVASGTATAGTLYLTQAIGNTGTLNSLSVTGGTVRFGSGVTVAGSLNASGGSNSSLGGNLTGTLSASEVSSVSVSGNLTGSLLATGTSSVNLGGNLAGTLFATGSSSVVLGGNVSQNISASDASSVSLASTKSIGGNVTLDSSTLILAASDTISGNATLSNASTLSLGASNTISGSVTLSDASSVIVENDNVISGRVSLLSGSSLNLAAGGSASVGSLKGDLGTSVVLGGSSLYITAATGTLQSVISGNGGLIVAGGTLTVSGTVNTFAGGVVVNAARLNIGTASAIGTGTLSLNSGAVIDNVSGAALTLTNNNEHRWNGDFTFVGTRDLNLGSGSVTLTATPLATVTAGNLTVDGVITGAFGLTKAGAGTLTLTNANSDYSGATIISAGTLSVATLDIGGAASSLGASTNVPSNLVFNGGTLQYTGGDASTDRNFTVNDGSTAVFDVKTTATNLTMDGDGLAGAGGTAIPVAKVGAGTLTLSGVKSFTTLDVNGGSLVLAGGATFGVDTGTLSGTDAVALNVRNGATADLGGSTQNVGFVTLYDGTIASGQLQGTGFIAQNGSITSNLNDSVAGGTVAAFNKESNGTASGGKVRLYGTNSYTGDTTLNAGTLEYNADNTINGNLNVNNAAQLTISSGTQLTLSSLTGVNSSNGGLITTTTGAIGSATGGSLNLAAGGNTFNVASGTLKVQVRINGGTLSKTGAGSLTLDSAANQFGGTLNGLKILNGTVNAGTVNGNYSLAWPTSPANSAIAVYLSGGTGAVNATRLNATGTLVIGALTGGGSLSTDTVTYPNGVITSVGTFNLGGAGNFVTVGKGTDFAGNFSANSPISGGTLIIDTTVNGGVSSDVVILRGTASDNSGKVQLQNGILRVLNPSALGPKANQVQFLPGAAGAVDLYGNNLTVQGLRTDDGLSSTLVVENLNPFGAPATLTVNPRADAALPNIYGGRIVDGNQKLSLTVGGAAAGQGGITAGTLRLTNGNNTYTGDTSVGKDAAGNGFTLQYSQNNTVYGDLYLQGGIVSVDTGTILSLSAGKKIRVTTDGGTFEGSGKLAIAAGGNEVGVDAGGNFVASGIIVGGTLTKSGAGSLSLSGANDFSGTVVTAGTLNVNSASALGTAGMNSATLSILGGALDNTSGGAVTVSGVVNQSWKGSFSFIGTNDLDMGSGNVTVDAPLALNAQAGNLVIGGGLSGASLITKNGAGTLTVSGQVNLSAGLHATAGALNLGGAQNTINGVSLDGTAQLYLWNVNGLGGGELSVDGSAAANLGGKTQQAASVSLLGGSILNGTLIANGGYNLQSGVITANLSGAGVSASISKSTSGTVVLGGSLDLGGNVAVSAGSLGMTTASTSQILGSLTVANGTLNASGPVNIGGAASVSAGSLLLNGASNTIAGSFTASGGATASIGANSGTQTLLNLSAQNASVSVKGAAIIAGNLAADTSTVSVGAAGVSSSVGGQLKSTNSTVSLAGQTTVGSVSAQNSVLSGNANITVAGELSASGGTTTFNGDNNAISGALSLTGSTLTLGTTNVGTQTLGGISAQNSVITTYGNTTVNGALAVSSGSATFNGWANTVTGAVSVTGSTLTVGVGIVGTQTLGSISAQNSVITGKGNTTVLGALTASGGTTTLDGQTNTVNGAVSLAGSTLTVGVGNVGTQTLGSVSAQNSVITANGATTVLGTLAATGGTTTLNASTNTINGAVTLSGSTLTVGAVGTAGAQTLGAISANASTVTVRGTANIARLAAGNNSTVTLNGSNGTVSGGVSVDHSTLTVGGANNLGSLALTEGTANLTGTQQLTNVTLVSGNINGGVITGTGSHDVQSGAITATLDGTASLTKSTSGTVYLNNSPSVNGGVNSYSGGTNLNGGVLKVASVKSLGSGKLTFNGGNLEVVASGSTTLNQQWNSDVAIVVGSSATFNGNVTLSGDRSVTITGGVVTVNGAIGGGANALTKDGTGTLSLTGVNTYTGVTTIKAGALQLGGSSTLAGSIVINSGASLDLTQSNLRLGDNSLSLNGGSITGSGTIQLKASQYRQSLSSTLSSDVKLGLLIDTQNFSFNQSATLANLDLSTNSATVGSGTSVSVAGNFSAGAPMTVAGNLTVQGDVNTSSTLAVTAGGSLQVGRAGATTVMSVGTLAMGALSADYSRLVLNGNVNFSGIYKGFGSISGPGTFALKEGASLDIGASPGSALVSSAILVSAPRVAVKWEYTTLPAGATTGTGVLADLIYLDAGGSMAFTPGSSLELNAIPYSAAGKARILDNLTRSYQFVALTGAGSASPSARQAIASGILFKNNNPTVSTVAEAGTSADVVNIKVTRNPFAGFGTGNVSLAGKLLDGELANTDTAISGVIDQLDAKTSVSDINEVLKSLNPALYAELPNLAFDRMRDINAAISNRVGGLADEVLSDLGSAKSESGLSAWTTTFGGWAKRVGDSTSGAPGYSATTWGDVSGVEKNLGSMKLGLLGAGATTTAKVGDNSGRVTTDSWHAGLYGSLPTESLIWDASLTYGNADSSVHRGLPLLGTGSSNATATVRDTEWMGQIGVSRPFWQDKTSLLVTPSVHLMRGSYHQDAVAENGAGSLGAKIGGKNAQATSARTGVQAAKAVKLLGKPSRLTANINWVHEFESSTRDLDIALNGSTAGSQRFSSAKAGRDAIRLGLGFETALSKSVRVSGSLERQTQSGESKSYGSLSLGVQF